MDIEYDPRAKAIYIRVKEGDVARTKSLDALVNVDYLNNGEVLGIEILAVGSGVNFSKVTGEAETVEEHPLWRDTPRPLSKTEKARWDASRDREPKSLAQAIVDWLVEWKLLKDRQQTERYLHDGD